MPNFELWYVHFLSRFGKKYSFIKIYIWRNHYKFQKLCQAFDYNIIFKKNRNLLYDNMLLFLAVAWKKVIFPQIWSKIPFFFAIICVLAYGEANTDTWNLLKHKTTVYYSTANENRNEIDVRSTFMIVRIDRFGTDYQSVIDQSKSIHSLPIIFQLFNRLNHSYCFIDPFIPQKYEIEKRTKFTKVHKVSDVFSFIYLFNLFIYLFNKYEHPLQRHAFLKYQTFMPALWSPFRNLNRHLMRRIPAG